MTLTEIFYEVHGKRQAELLAVLGPEDAPDAAKAEALQAFRQQAQAGTPHTLADYLPELMPYYEQPEAHLDELLETLATTDYLSRGVVANLLKNSTNPTVREALYRLAETDPSSLVRQHAVAALGKHATDTDRAYLRQVLERPPVPPTPPSTNIHVILREGGPMDIRSGAAEALSDANDRESVPLLLSLIQDHSLPCQSAAVRALGTLGDPQAIAPLKALYESLQDRDDRRSETLRKTLARALKQLQPEDA